MAKRRYEKPEVPDGGRGWLVCLGSFCLQALAVGTVWSFGILFVQLLKEFQRGQVVTVCVGAIQAATLNLIGIVTLPLLHRFGWRAITLTGGLFSVIGFSSSALTPNLYFLYVTYGLFTGIGNGLMLTTSTVIVHQYFSRYRRVANVIAMSGAGVGIAGFGLLTKYLITLTGWRWTLVITAGITLVLTLFSSLLYHPLPQKLNTVQFPQYTPENQQNGASRELPHNDSQIDTQYDYVRSDSLLDLSGVETVIVTIRLSAPIFCVVPSMVEDSGMFDSEYVQQPNVLGNTVNNYQMWPELKDSVDLGFLRNTFFNLFNFAMLLWSCSYLMMYTFVPVWSLAIGSSYWEAAFLLVIMGVVITITQLICGVTADRIPRKRFDVCGVMLAIQGIVGLLSAAVLQYYTLMAYCTLIAVTIGCVSTLYPVILVDLLGREKFNQALNLIILVRTLACLLATPLSALIIDSSWTYHIVIPFMSVVGGLCCLAAFLYFLILCLHQPSYRLNDAGGLIKSQLYPRYDDRMAEVEEAQPFVMQKTPDRTQPSYGSNRYHSLL